MPGGEQREEIESILGEAAMFADGFDDALIGICERFGHSPVALYDQDKCLAILMEKNECTLEEAFEYLSFNVLQAYVGDRTPAFAVIVGKDGEQFLRHASAAST